LPAFILFFIFYFWEKNEFWGITQNWVKTTGLTTTISTTSSCLTTSHGECTIELLYLSPLQTAAVNSSTSTTTSRTSDQRCKLHYPCTK
jgi:hypothetical protein